MNLIDGILDTLNKLTRRVSRLESQGAPRWVYLTTPLTSTDWDGDPYSTTVKTLIDLSAVFAVPAGVKAIDVWVRVNDAASAAGDYILILSPNDTADSGISFTCPRSGNDHYGRYSAVIPCSASGDIYFQIAASGAGTMDVYIRIFGYLI